MTQVQVVCCDPACPGRVVEGESVTRETWEATWHEPRWGQSGIPGEWTSSIACPSCGQDGIDPESGQLDSAEEELGVRCKFCGVVSDVTWDRPGGQPPCPHCGEREAFVIRRGVA